MINVYFHGNFAETTRFLYNYYASLTMMRGLDLPADIRVTN